MHRTPSARINTPSEYFTLPMIFLRGKKDCMYAVLLCVFQCHEIIQYSMVDVVDPSSADRSAPVHHLTVTNNETAQNNVEGGLREIGRSM